MLKFFMGKNTPDRQEYIIRNLRFEHDIVDDEVGDDPDSLGSEAPSDSLDDSEAA